jgi:hypothetical protein
VRKLLLAVTIFTVFPLLLLAQQILNNDSVIKMVKMGFGDDMIVNAINRSPATFDTTMDGMIALKSAGVDNKVVGAMVVKMTTPAPGPAAPVEAAPAPAALPVSAPAAPAPAPSPVPAARAPYAPPLGKPRVYLESKSHGNLWNATRDQSMEMSKDFEQLCPDVRISINPQAADYTVDLNHIEHGFARDNQLQVANRDGDLIARTKEGGSIKSRVKSACNDILADWAGVKR